MFLLCPLPTASMANFSQININLEPSHYFNDYWVENADPYISELPFMKAGIPIFWGIFVLTIGFIHRFIGPWLMTNRKPYDCKPWMICINGFIFGWNTIGLLGVAVPSNYYTDCFSCSAYNKSANTIESLTIKHFAYGIVFAKFVNLIIFPSFKFLTKQHDRMSDLHLLYLMSVSMASVCLVKLQPGGIFIFCGLIETIEQIVLYSYLTFASASDYFKPSKTWKMAILFTKMISWTCVLAHSAYFLSIPNCGDQVIKLLLVGFSSLVVILFPYDFYRLDAIAEEKRKIASLAKEKKKSSLLESNNNSSNGNTGYKSDELTSMAKARLSLEKTFT